MHCGSETIKALSEISLNTLKGTISVDRKSKNILNKYKNCLRKLACPKTSVKAKRDILVQKGGFLPTLIGVVLSSVLGSLLQQ